MAVVCAATDADDERRLTSERAEIKERKWKANTTANVERTPSIASPSGVCEITPYFLWNLKARCTSQFSFRENETEEAGKEADEEIKLVIEGEEAKKSGGKKISRAFASHVEGCQLPSNESSGNEESEGSIIEGSKREESVLEQSDDGVNEV